MATYVERSQAIANALVNAIATQIQINRLARALAYHVGIIDEYDLMTNAQKAEFFVTRMRRYAIDLVKRHDEAIATATAIANAGTAVDSEFPG